MQADGFAGLLFRGIDVEIRSEGKDIKAIGMDDPESEDDALILGADQVIPDEFVERVESFSEWDRPGPGRNRHRRGCSGSDCSGLG